MRGGAVDLTTDMTMSGGATASDQRPISAEAAQEATARMFRSVRAGRSWVRAQNASSSPQSAACVLMKPGNDEPPLFMIPGAPGSILQLGPFAAALPVPMPVYAIKPRGLEEGETPRETIAEMAEYAIGAMQAVRPHGPYLLVGYSAGGLIALEMAQRLAVAGDAVPFIVLLDTYPSKQVWPLKCHAEILARQTGRAIRSLRQYSPSQAASEIARRSRSLMEYLAASGVRLLPPPPVVPEGWSAASRRVHVATFNAGEAYRPAPYSGKVIFAQAEEIADQEPSDPGRVWRRFLSDFETRKVPGGHIAMVEENAGTTAAAVGECVMRTLLRERSGSPGATSLMPNAAGSLQPSMESQQCP
jgi:acetoacetyl-CoA synthetase